ncbi:MAG: hypothetical protein GXO45_01635 [Aquificae bacterium]|nr:hypothetical protein [Aquificota bacterium]
MRALVLSVFVFTFSFALDYEDIKRSYYRSYQYEKVGDYENAIRALAFVYSQYPNEYTINLRLGWLYYLAKKYANSIFHYEKAIMAIPTSIEARLGYLLPLLAKGDYSLAEKVCYQILNKDYYNYYGNLRLIYALKYQRKYKTAYEVASKMTAIYPTDVNFLTELAVASYYLGKRDFAKKLFKDILILDPENKTAKRFLRYP